MWDNAKALNAVSLALTACAVAALLAAALLWAARQPVFAIHRVVVSGELKEVDPAHLAAVARESLRGTFFTLELNAAQAAFARVPWVRSVAVRRHWPDQLDVSVVEHTPLARWNPDVGEPTLVNTHGEVFQARHAGELPSFTGPEGTAGEVTGHYLEFAPALARIGRTVSGIRLSSRRAWELTLDNSLIIELGRDGESERLARFVMFYPSTIARVAGRVESVDMRYRNGFAARVPGFRERAVAGRKA
jgi:cell division protein FtsQ